MKGARRGALLLALVLAVAGVAGVAGAKPAPAPNIRVGADFNGYKKSSGVATGPRSGSAGTSASNSP
jgi:hypothetical protein